MEEEKKFLRGWKIVPHFLSLETFNNLFKKARDGGERRQGLVLSVCNSVP